MSRSNISSTADSVEGRSRTTPATIGGRALRVLAVLGLTLTFAFVTVGCGDDNDTGGGEAPTTETSGADNYGYGADEPRKNEEGELLPPPVQIYGATDSGKKVGKDTVVVVNSQKEFEKLQKQIFKGQEARPLPSTDFKTRQMIVVFLKPKANGAQTQVSMVRKGDGEFTVTAVRLLPGAGCPGANRASAPYSIVETDKLKGSAKLVVEDQRQPDCK